MFRGFSQGYGRALLRTLIPAALLIPVLFGNTAEAKTPGHSYCFNGVCHDVFSIAETADLIGQDTTFSTSFYDDCSRDRFNPCGLTSSGEVFHADTPDNAASPIYPDGTVLMVRNGANGRTAVVRVNNAGPYHGNRKLDVSRATAEELGFKKRGVARLQVRVLSAPTKAEARYKKNRHYDEVAGFIGKFASLDAADPGTRFASAKSSSSKISVAASVDRVTPLFKGSKMASADNVMIAPVAAENESPADGLRAAVRRSLGLEPLSRRVAPSVMTAESQYGHAVRF